MSLFGLLNYRPILKCAMVALALAGLLVLSGCWVESINPLYEDGFLSSKDPDVILDQRLIGSWSMGDDKCTYVLTISAKDEVYGLLSTEQGGGCSDSAKQSRYRAQLVKLDDHYFFDSSPMPDDVCDECIAKHTIYQLKIDKDALSFTPINSDWLKKSIDAKTVTLATLPDDTDTLIASTKDLTAFCREYAADPAVFKPMPELMFKRK